MAGDLFFWRNLQALRDKVLAVPGMLDWLARDPVGVLTEHSIEVEVDSGTGELERRSLAALLGCMPEQQRQTVLQSLMTLLAVPETQLAGGLGNASNRAQTRASGALSFPASGTAPTDKDTLRLLVGRLDAAGYSEHYASYTPLKPNPALWEAHAASAPVDLVPLVRLFLLRKAEHEEVLIRILGATLCGRLREMGLLLSAGHGRLRTPNIVLLPALGCWILCQSPELKQTLYFDADSIALALRLRPKRDGRVLDLCAGTGFQALVCSGLAREVVAVEINPIAAELARLNVKMNDREEVIRVRCGDLYSAVGEEQFDTIVANPPFLPLPEEIDYPLTGHGGADGMRTTWRILKGLPSRLAREGHAQIIGTCLSSGARPVIAERLEAWSSRSRMDTLMTITAQRDISSNRAELVNMLSRAVAHSVCSRAADVESQLAEHLRARSGTHFCGFFLYIRHGAGRFRLQSMAGPGSQTFWFTESRIHRPASGAA